MFRLVLLTLCCVAMVISMEDTAREKRLVLHSDEDVAAAFQTLAAQIQSMNATMESLKHDVQSKETTIQSLQTTSQSLLALIQTLQSTAQTRDATIQSLQATVQAQESKLPTGSTYIRWGRTVCPANGTELVYKGFAAGTTYRDEGGAADYICLTQDPLWGHYDDTNNNCSPRVQGAEYQFDHQFLDDGGEAMFGQRLHDHDVPCAVCRAPRAVTLMIPGRNQCYPGWNKEYSGYLVSGRQEHVAASNYACLDSRAEVEFGDAVDQNGHLMYVAEAACGSLKCPPYVENRELTCVVCSM